MKKQFFLATAASALVVPAIIAPIQPEAAVNEPFKDVSTANPYYKIIHDMRDNGIISGYENGLFKPNEQINRKHAAALISRTKGKDLPKHRPLYIFKDVPKDNVYFNNIAGLQQAGIFMPDGKGNFNPNKPITRAEMAKVLTIAFKLDVKEEKSFSDVPANHPENDYIQAIYSNGITTGDNGKFKPYEPLTRAHYAVFMWRALQAEDALNNPSKPQKPTSSLTEEEVKGMTNEQVAEYVTLLQRKNNSPIQLPQGEKNAEALTNRLKAEYTAHYLKNVMNLRSEMKLSTTSVWKAHTLFTETFPGIFGSTSKNAIELVNKVYREGIVITDENAGFATTEKFTMYYNYQTGWLIIGILNK